MSFLEKFMFEMVGNGIVTEVSKEGPVSNQQKEALQLTIFNFVTAAETPGSDKEKAITEFSKSLLTLFPSMARDPDTKLAIEDTVRTVIEKSKTMPSGAEKYMKLIRDQVEAKNRGNGQWNLN